MEMGGFVRDDVVWGIFVAEGTGRFQQVYRRKNNGIFVLGNFYYW